MAEQRIPAIENRPRLDLRGQKPESGRIDSLECRHRRFAEDGIFDRLGIRGEGSANAPERVQQAFRKRFGIAAWNDEGEQLFDDVVEDDVVEEECVGAAAQPTLAPLRLVHGAFLVTCHRHDA